MGSASSGILAWRNVVLSSACFRTRRLSAAIATTRWTDSMDFNRRCLVRPNTSSTDSVKVPFCVEVQPGWSGGSSEDPCCGARFSRSCSSKWGCALAESSHLCPPTLGCMVYLPVVTGNAKTASDPTFPSLDRQVRRALPVVGSVAHVFVREAHGDNAYSAYDYFPRNRSAVCRPACKIGISICYKTQTM